ncbi:MAG: FG-GAP-like repeat-containing protein [Myxococcota bacterium]
MFRLWIGSVVLLAGCSEHELSWLGENPGQDAQEDQPRTCDAGSLDGYAAEADPTCALELETGTFTPFVEYHYDNWGVEPESNNIMMTPVVGPLDDDNEDGVIDENDIPDIVVVTYGLYGTLRAVSGDGRYELFNVTGHPLQGQGSVAIGDIDSDGLNEIVACTTNQIIAFDNQGGVQWTSPTIRGHIHSVSDTVSIADMDGDGSPEIIAGRAILNGSDGSIRGHGSHGRGNTSNVGTSSFAADVDLNGIMEVVTGNALYDPDGETIWYNGMEDGYVAVANFDDDPEAEIVVSNDGNLRLQDTDGATIWNATYPGGGGASGGPPTVADFDGDGKPEIGVASRSAYTVIDTNGEVLWSTSTQDITSGNTGSAVFDFEGDGVAEVVYADEAQLWVFAGPDGSIKMKSADHANQTWLEYAVIADVDNDGHVEIVAPNTGPLHGFHVIGDLNDTWRPGRNIWNQHAYSITNVNDDGSIPRTPAPNWLTFNNFRSGALEAGDGLAAPDFSMELGEICELDCSEGELTLWIHAGNIGASNQLAHQRVELVLSTVSATSGEETEFGRYATDEILIAGEYQPTSPIQLSADTETITDWSEIRVRLETQVRECNVDNNLLVIEGPFCQ